MNSQVLGVLDRRTIATFRDPQAINIKLRRGCNFLEDLRSRVGPLNFDALREVLDGPA
jgi:hypothetical protein